MNKDKYINKLINKLADIVIYKSYRTQIWSSKMRNHVAPEYTLEEYNNWCKQQPNFKNIMYNWINNDFNSKYKLSADRLDNSVGYNFNNIQLVTWGENEAKEQARKRKPIDYNTPVLVFDITGELLQKYNSISEVAVTYGVDITTYYQITQMRKLYDGINNIFVLYNDNMLTTRYKQKITNIINYNLNRCSRVIFQYDNCGNFIRSYESIVEAAIANNITATNIQRAIVNKRYLVKGYIWLRGDTDDIEKRLNEVIDNINKGDIRSLRLLQIDTDGNIIKTYNSLNEAVNNGYNKGNIGSAAIGNRKLAHGYIWMYEKDYNLDNLKIRLDSINTHKIIQLDMNNNIISEYSNMYDAMRKTGISPSKIAMVVSGKRKTAGGYIWKQNK